MCLDHNIELCNSAPRYLCCSTDCKSVLIIDRIGMQPRMVIKIEYTHLAGFNIICHCLVHSTKVFKSYCK